MTTMAAVDRLVHHSIILEFDGNSYRADAHKTQRKTMASSIQSNAVTVADN